MNETLAMADCEGETLLAHLIAVPAPAGANRRILPVRNSPKPVARDPRHDEAMALAERCFAAYAATFRELAK